MLTFASSLPCLHTFWHAIPTSSYIFNVFYFHVYIQSVTDYNAHLVAFLLLQLSSQHATCFPSEMTACDLYISHVSHVSSISLCSVGNEYRRISNNIIQ